MTRRSYRQLCPSAHALDLVGERWTLLVVRELVLGPKRFTDLVEGLPGIGTNILSARLKELEAAGVVTRERLAPPAASKVYELTEWGRELEDVVLGLGRWGAKSPTFGGAEMVARPEWTVLALKAMFRPQSAADAPATAELRFGEEAYALTIADGKLDIRHGADRHPELVVSLDVRTLAGILLGRVDPKQALATGAVTVEGRRNAFVRLVRFFVRPH